jgi:hypothetical protein
MAGLFGKISGCRANFVCLSIWKEKKWKTDRTIESKQQKQTSTAKHPLIWLQIASIKCIMNRNSCLCMTTRHWRAAKAAAAGKRCTDCNRRSPLIAGVYKEGESECFQISWPNVSPTREDERDTGSCLFVRSLSHDSDWNYFKLWASCIQSYTVCPK